MGDKHEPCPDTNGECPFNQVGAEATYRFESGRLLYDILMTLKKKKKLSMKY